MTGLLLSLCSPPLGSAQPAIPAAIPTSRCEAPAGFTTPARPLPQLAAAVEAAGPVEVLAIGSGTTSGQDSSGDAAFPRRMVDALRERLPRVDWRLTVRGGIGMTAAEMLRLLEAELGAHRFDLVIWQTGTVEAVHDLSASELEATLATGADKVHVAGGDLILIGPQFSRMLSGRANLDRYVHALTAAAAAPSTVMFDRLGLTRLWVEDGAVDLERVTTKGDRQAMLEMLHACVGNALARFVLSAAEQP